MPMGLKYKEKHYKKVGCLTAKGWPLKDIVKATGYNYAFVQKASSIYWTEMMKTKTTD
jgi:hypothetical protein